MVAKKMVHEGCPRVAITPNCHTLIHTISVMRNEVVELIGHAARPRHIGHTVERNLSVSALQIKMKGNFSAHG